MKVRTQLLLILLSVIVSIAALSLWLRFKIKRETDELLQQILVETREKDVPKILKLHEADISGSAYYYSAWDQMVDFLAGKKNEAWAKEALDNAVANYKIDYIWVIDKNGSAYYNSATRSVLSARQLDVSPSQLSDVLAKQNFQSFFINHNSGW